MNLTEINPRFRVWMILFGSLCLPGIQVSLGWAQVTTAITSSGLNTLVSPNATNPAIFEITGGTRPGGGPNLFHSFGEFTIGAIDTARFLNATPELLTSNILSRVTGGTPSNIFGTIDTVTEFAGANFWLINPAGVVFGPTASLNVGGSVHISTADYLRLQDPIGANAGVFSASPLVSDALTIAPVAAFGFLGSNPVGIAVQGSQLSVPTGQGISLVGGDITVQRGTLNNGTVQPARLSAPGGKINLASVASSGEILTGTLDQASNINGQSFGALGTIQVSQNSVIEASGDGGGTILIRGGRFVLDDSRISANTTGPAEGPLVDEPGAGIDIQVAQDVVIENAAILETNVAQNVAAGIGSGGVYVKADRIEILGVPDFETFPFTGIRSDVAPGSTGGKSGDIVLEANSIRTKDLANIETITRGAGDAGNIILHANENLELDGVFIDSESLFASGNAGNLELTSKQGNILMTNFPIVTSQTFESSGNAGAIKVTAEEGNILLADLGFINTAIRPPAGVSLAPGTGAGGRIQLTANNLQLLNFSFISGDNLGPMLPGDITVTLSGSLSLRGGSVIQTVSRSPLGAPSADLNVTAKDILITEDSGLSTESLRSGQGGNLTILADTLQVTNGGQIRSGASGSGGGGTITVQGLASPATSVVIDGTVSGIFTNTQGTGAGGSINISSQSVTMQNGGTLSAATSGTAASATGGAIMVNAGTVQLNSGAMITAESTGLGDAGSITLSTTGNTVTLATGSRISSSSTGTMANAGDAGSVTVNAGNSFQSSGSTVATSAAQGQGGNITITASQEVTLNNGTNITASSTGQGDAGNITINAGGTLLMEDSSVTTQAAQAGGGDITVNAGDMVRLINSQINTSVAGGPETAGGNITIDPNFVILQNSQILAQAFQGAGGNINITAGTFLADANSLVDASSQFGLSGTVTIQSPTSNLSAVWARLQQNYAEVAAMLRARCAAQVSGQYSSFVQTGRDAIPLEPGGWLLSPISLSADAGRGARGEGARSVVASTASLASEGGILSLRGFDQNLSWPGVGKMPRRFVSILDSMCGS